MADVAGAALGAPFGLALQELYALLKDVVQKARRFKSLLKRIKTKLETLTEWVERIRKLTEELDMKAKEIRSFNEQKNEREELVRKCLEISKWDLRKRYKYANKLSKLEKDLQQFIDFFFPLFNATVGLENQLYLKDIQVTVHEIRESQRLGVRNGGLSFPVPPPPTFIVGLDEHMKELKGMLLKKEVSVLALTAPGGCGKTTLVTMLCRDEEIKGIFKENIFFICLSKVPNLKDIVDKLFDNKGRQVPRSGRVEDEIDQLGEQLNQIEGPTLLILDDVQSDSEYLLEKFQLHMPNYKILLTSRTVSPKFHSTYKLKPLKDKDAMTLFRHSTSPQDGSLSISDKEMKKILKFCGGFPLALKVTGSSLCGKPPEACRSLLKKQSSGLSILGSKQSSDLLDCLQKSLDVLDDETTKECFQDLGLFPEDQRIPVSALIDMWAELYDLDEDGNDAITKLHEISNRDLAGLVLMRKAESDVGKYYNEDFVLQHDLLRELAIRQSYRKQIEQQERLTVDISENNHPKWWSEQNPPSIKAHILSITTDVNFSSSCCNIHPSEVKVLLLHFQTESYTLPEFVTKMHKLKVLIVTNYGFSCAKLSNFQLLNSTPCLRKIRLEKVSISSLCNAPLMHLEKISLIMCNIQQAFSNCTNKISDALPKLMELNIDYCNDLVELPDEIFEIACLKKLSITNCHKLSNLSQRLEELTNLEVLRLRSCTDLLQLPESIKSLHKLNVLDISDCLSIIRLPKHIGELCNLKELHMEGCLRFRSQLPLSTLDLAQLKLVTCDEAVAKSWESIKEFLSELQVKVVVKDVNLNWLCNPET